MHSTPLLGAGADGAGAPAGCDVEVLPSTPSASEMVPRHRHGAGESADCERARASTLTRLRLVSCGSQQHRDAWDNTHLHVGRLCKYMLFRLLHPVAIPVAMMTDGRWSILNLPTSGYGMVFYLSQICLLLTTVLYFLFSAAGDTTQAASLLVVVWIINLNNALLRATEIAYMTKREYEIFRSRRMNKDEQALTSILHWGRPSALSVWQHLMTTAMLQNIDLTPLLFSFVYAPEDSANLAEVFGNDGSEQLNDVLQLCGRENKMGSGVLAGPLVVTTLLLRSRATRFSLLRMYAQSLLVSALAPAVAIGLTYDSDEPTTVSAQLMTVLGAVSYVTILAQSVLYSRIGASDFSRRRKALSALDSLVAERTRIRMRSQLPMATPMPALLPLHRPRNIVAWMNARLIIKRFGSSVVSQFQLFVGMVLVEYLLFFLLLVVSILVHPFVIPTWLIIYASYPVLVMAVYVLSMMLEGGKINKAGIRTARMLYRMQLAARARVAQLTVREVATTAEAVKEHCVAMGCSMGVGGAEAFSDIIPAGVSPEELRAADRVLEVARNSVLLDEQQRPLTFLAVKMSNTMVRSAGTVVLSIILAGAKHYLPTLLDKLNEA